MLSAYHSSESFQFPDSATIAAGTVPARWYRNIDLDLSSTTEVKHSPSDNSTSKSVVPVTQTRHSPTLYNCASSTIVECELCPRKCRISPNLTGRCSARININGNLQARFYGRPVSLAIDPIEKKPLYHFLPGSKILSLGTQGCNLSCRHCQNWQISHPLPAGSTITNVLTPQNVLELAFKHNIPSVAFTYNEPSIWAEYVIDTGKICRANGIRTVAITNGMISGAARRDFYKEIDAANVDLKAFTESFYQKITGGSLEDVKETLKYIVRETRTWLEITNLLIPSYNDSDSEIRTMCKWIVNELGENIPIHFSAFYPTGRLTDVPRTPIDSLVRASQIAKETGIRYVYLGNVDKEKGQNTFCPKCGVLLIQRSGYQTECKPPFEKISNSHQEIVTTAICSDCRSQIVGVY